MVWTSPHTGDNRSTVRRDSPAGASTARALSDLMPIRDAGRLTVEQGVVTALDPYAEAILGHDRTFVGAPVETVRLPTTVLDLLRHAEDAAAGEPVERTELSRLLDADGEPTLVEITVNRGPRRGDAVVLRLQEVRRADALDKRREVRATTAALMATATDLAKLGSYEWDLDDGTSWNSPAFLAIHGLDPEDPSGALGAREYLRLVHPDDRARIQRLTARVGDGAEAIALVEWRIVRPDGVVRRVRCKAEIVGAGGGRAGRVVGTIQDVTDADSSDIGIGLHLALAAAVVAWPDGPRPAQQMLSQIANSLAARAAVLWTIGRDPTLLRCRRCWSRDGNAASDALDALASESAFRRGEGLPGRVWAERRPVSGTGLEHRLGYVRRTFDLGPGFEEQLGFPVESGTELIGVVELYFGDAPPLSTILNSTLAAVGDQLGAFFAAHVDHFGYTPLTDREQEVLQLAADGGTIASLAATMDISESTVKTHLEHLHAKLGVTCRSAAVAEGFRAGLIQ